MRYILWIVGLLALVGSTIAAGCEGVYVRERPYYYSEENPYYDFYYGEPEPYYFFDGHRSERREWMEDRGHESGERHVGGEVHGGGAGHGGRGR